MYYPSWYLPPPIVLSSVQGHDVVGNGEILSLIADVLQAMRNPSLSAAQVVHMAWYAWLHLDRAAVCQDVKVTRSKTKKHDLQDEEQVEAGHDRRGQLAILVQGKRRPEVHLGLLTQGFR